MADHDNTRPRRRRLHLTDATAKRLAASGKPKIHYDADLRGFGLRTGGRAAWILAYSLNRVEHRVTIGTLAAWPAKAARIRAQELRQMVDRGQDPLQQRLDERAEKTERVKPVRAVRARSRRRWYPAIGGARMMPRLTRCCARCSSRCSGCHGRRWRSGYIARSSKLPAPKSAASSWAGSSRSGARETITSMRSRTARRRNLDGSPAGEPGEPGESIAWRRQNTFTARAPPRCWRGSRRKRRHRQTRQPSQARRNSPRRCQPASSSSAAGCSL